MKKGKIKEGKFCVFKIWKRSGKRLRLESNLTEKEAQRLVQSHPNNTYTMVGYGKQ